MSIGQSEWRLGSNSFVRKYDDIGIIYDQVTQKQLVFDHNGMLFLSQLARAYRSVNAIADHLLREYNDVDINQLKSDVHAFCVQLYTHGFLETTTKPKQSPVSQAINDGSRSLVNDCDLVEASRYLKDYFQKKPRIFSFQYAVTNQCNEHCIHCYVDRQTGPTLSLARSLEVIDELSAMGTLGITFTGGEALSFPGLASLIARARENDFVISLLSNLTLMTDALFEILTSSNLQQVQASIYSMDPVVHDSITRLDGSHKRTLSVLERLRNAGVRVNIGCPVLRSNLGSFHSVLAYGRANDIAVRPDLVIIAKESGDSSNLNQRISITDIEPAIRTILAEASPQPPIAEGGQKTAPRQPIYDCGIGSYKLSMNANGDILPCPGFGLVVGNVASTQIKDIWDNSTELKKLRSCIRIKMYPQCQSCEASDYCLFCLAKFHNECNWDQGVIPEYFCEVARMNKKAVEYSGMPGN